MSKKLLGGVIITTGLLTGCSKSHTENEEYGIKETKNNSFRRFNKSSSI